MSDWEAGDSERQHNPLRANGLAMNSFRCFLKRLSKQQTLFIPSTPSHSGCLDTRNMPAGDGSFDSRDVLQCPVQIPRKLLTLCLLGLSECRANWAPVRVWLHERSMSRPCHAPNLTCLLATSRALQAARVISNRHTSLSAGHLLASAHW